MSSMVMGMYVSMTADVPRHSPAMTTASTRPSADLACGMSSGGTSLRTRARGGMGEGGADQLID
jgi:hypothetical protein